MFQKEIQGKKSIELDSVHNIYSDKGKVVGSVNFSFEERESSGTNKLLDLSGPIFDTLYTGATLVIDELDAKMHPLISQYIIELFNNHETNPKNAQLIFTTHDTHLLSQKILRRDQIWFTEKDSQEQTDLYSLMDIVLPDGTKPRNDANYERNYIAGRYGAIPYILTIKIKVMAAKKIKIDNASFKFKKQTQRREQKVIRCSVLIVCEGTKTEPNYFDAFAQKQQGIIVYDIEVKGLGRGTKDVVEKAIALKIRTTMTVFGLYLIKTNFLLKISTKLLH